MSRRLPCFWTRTIQLLEPVLPTTRKSPSPSPRRPGRVAALTPVAESLPIPHILPSFFPTGKFGCRWISADAGGSKPLRTYGFFRFGRDVGRRLGGGAGGIRTLDT